MKTNKARIKLVCTFVALSIFFILGCSSGAAFKQKPATTNGSGVVYIYRPSKVMGLAVGPRLFVDKQFVAEIANGGYLRLELSPGDHQFFVTMKQLHLNCGFGNITIKSGEEYFLRYILETETRVGDTGKFIVNALWSRGVIGALSGDIFDQDKSRLLVLESPPKDIALSEIAETTLIVDWDGINKTAINK
jgi:hypothetical protein